MADAKLTPRVRDMVREISGEMREHPDLSPDRATELLNKLASLSGSCDAEILVADHDYALVLSATMQAAGAATKARIIAETTPQFQRRREARATKELVKELMGALKYRIRNEHETMRSRLG